MCDCNQLVLLAELLDRLRHIITQDIHCSFQEPFFERVPRMVEMPQMEDG